MQKRKDEIVETTLGPFRFHGVVLGEEVRSDQVTGDCPFCGKSDHFRVNITNGLWDCKRCGESGNVVTFLDKWHQHWMGHARAADWQRLEQDRGIPSSIFKGFDMALNGDGKWLLPIRTFKGTMTDLRVWRYGGKEISTKGRHTGLFGCEQLADPSRKEEPVFITEGFGDRAALTWLLKVNKRDGIVVATPGANTFKETWVDYFIGRNVYLCDDNDIAGDAGSKRKGKMLAPVARSVNYLCWPDTLATGFDVRDHVAPLVNGRHVVTDKPRKAWAVLSSLFKTHHRHSPDGQSTALIQKKGPTPTFQQVLDVFRRWLKTDDPSHRKDMDDAVRISLAVALSNQIPGDTPVWLFIVGPAGSGKTATLVSMSGSPHCVFESNIHRQALISGFNIGGEDPSLIPKLANKTFVLKDYTEVLASHPTVLEEVIGVLRGAFDGEVSRAFGNGVQRHYKVRFSMLAGVTNAIHGHSRATVGERFLKFQLIPEGPGFNADSAIDAAIRNIGKEDRMNEELRDVVGRFLEKKVDLKKVLADSYVPEWVYQRIIPLAQIIAMLRAQVERDQRRDEITYRPQHEVGSRLGKQLVKLAIALAAVEDKPCVDEETYKLVERVAFDTAIGFHLDLIQVMQVLREDGTEITKDVLSRMANLPPSTIDRKLADLSMLRLVNHEVGKNKLKRGLKMTFNLSPRIVTLWDKAKVNGNHVPRSIMARRRKNERLINTKSKRAKMRA